MADLEAAVVSQLQDPMSQHIRNRKNVTATKRGATSMNISTTVTPSEENLKSNQYLVQRINRASKNEDEDEFMRRAMIRHQNETNKRMAKGLLNLMLFLTASILFLYLYVTAGDEGSQSALAKSLGILLGIRKRTVVTLPKTKKVVSPISFMKTELDQYLYPSWPWSYSINNSQYLIPNSGKGALIKNILHRVTQLKKVNNLDVVLHDPNDVKSFLAGDKGKICSSVAASEHNSILEQYQLYGEYGAKDIQKVLWMWCLIYTNEAHGFLDLDSYDVQLGYSLISSLASNEFQNLVMDPNTMEPRNEETISPSLITSLLFVLDGSTNVPQQMLKFLLESNVDPSIDDLMKYSIVRMKELIVAEKEKWTLPKVDCIEQKEYFPLADICDESKCCQLIRPRGGT